MGHPDAGSRERQHGLASEEALLAAVEAGGHDISISLDTHVGSKQDYLNGEVKNSWGKAIKTMSVVTRVLPKKGSFAALGCVMSHRNLHEYRAAARSAWLPQLRSVDDFSS